MRISPNLFWDENIKKRKRKRLLGRLDKDKRLKKESLILRIEGDPNLLHILSAREIARLEKRGSNFVLAGIAKDRDGAFKVVEGIVMAALKAEEAITVETIDKELDIQWH